MYCKITHECAYCGKELLPDDEVCVIAGDLFCSDCYKVATLIEEDFLQEDDTYGDW